MLVSGLPQTTTNHRSLADVLKESVLVGLLEFCRSHMANDAIIPLLHETILELQPNRPLPKWHDMREELRKRVLCEHGSTPLSRIIIDYQLSIPQLFFLALVGEVENSHTVNIVIAELQAPDKNPRPSLHLLSAIIKDLFASEAQDMDVFDIAQQKTIQQGLIHLSGNAPLPLQTLSITPFLWSVLCNRVADWSGCTVIDDNEITLPLKTKQQVTEIAAMFADDGSTQTIAGVVLRGNPHSGRHQFARHFANILGLKAMSIPLQLWFEHPDLAAFSRYSNWLPVIQSDIPPGETLHLPKRKHQPPVVIIMQSDGAIAGEQFIELLMDLPDNAERKQYWHTELQQLRYSEHLANSALLSAQTIQTIARSAKHLANQQKTTLSLKHVLHARRRLGVEKLRLLAQPVERDVSSDALVMPRMVEDNLNAIIKRACKRELLWEGLGTTLQATPNPGVRALFVGESGTGKTLAASYITTAISAPLYRVDLSAVMNKYIGESEKNLAQLLDQAAANDVVLLFDEADALFGSRTEGKETGERFANMLTNFLLTRIETHPGIVILTTNSKERLDNAFLRRIDAVVEFPLPGYEERLHLWRSHLGERGPGEQTYRTLASYCDLAGGQIRNAVLSAAVFAQGWRITDSDLLAGINIEYQKIGRSLPGKVMQMITA